MLIASLFIIPLFSLLPLLISKNRFFCAWINIVTGFCVLINSLLIVNQTNTENIMTFQNGWFYIDKLSAYLLSITTFIGFTTSIYSKNYFENEYLKEKLTAKSLKFYYRCYPIFLLAVLLTLVTNHFGIMWVALECATLSTVLLVALYQKPTGIEAAWKYLMLCGFGLMQALLGIFLLYFAASNVIDVEHALFWSYLRAHNHQLSAYLLSLAFIFALVGYGTKAGLVPLHHWLPDVYEEAPTPVLCLLSGILLNLAFYAILRFKWIIDGAVHSYNSNHFLLAFGSISLVFSAFLLLRQRNIKRFFAYSSIEHMGLISVAFGLGTPLSILAGILHMAAHALAKTAALFAAGETTQRANTSQIDHIHGLSQAAPLLGFGLLLSCFCLMGLPPSLIFISEFLTITTAVKIIPLFLLPLILGLGLAFAALLYKVQPMIFSASPSNAMQLKNKPSHAFSMNIFLIYLHLSLLIGLGICFSKTLFNWLWEIANF